MIKLMNSTDQDSYETLFQEPWLQAQNPLTYRGFLWDELDGKESGQLRMSFLIQTESGGLADCRSCFRLHSFSEFGDEESLQVELEYSEIATTTEH